MCLAAVLACGPAALLSHASAAWLWEISKRGPAPFQVTGPGRRRPRPPILLHHARNLAAEDRYVLDNIPVTALPRTYLDLAATVSSHNLGRALDKGEQRGVFDLGPVEAVLARNVGHPGAGRLRRALGIYRPPNVIRSKLEGRFLDRVRRAGLPTPSTNINVGGYELDMYWSRERFVVELDVYETHGTHAAFENDRLRQEDLLLLGIGMIRVTGPRFDREPQMVIERVARLLADRRER
jgi:very-short-patch-repair endonuclease